MRGGVEKSFFWGVTLDDAHREQKWEGTATENTVDCTVTTHTLSIRQCLGPGGWIIYQYVCHTLCDHSRTIAIAVPIPFRECGAVYAAGVVLGADAKEGEANVVELEVLGYNDKKHKIPICVSKTGGSYVTNVEILIEDQVATFHLTKGKGPVYLSGTHQTETNIIGEDDMDELAEEEGEDEEEEDEVEDSPPKKKSKQ